MPLYVHVTRQPHFVQAPPVWHGWSSWSYFPPINWDYVKDWRASHLLPTWWLIPLSSPPAAHSHTSASVWQSVSSYRKSLQLYRTILDLQSVTGWSCLTIKKSLKVQAPYSRSHLQPLSMRKTMLACVGVWSTSLQCWENLKYCHNKSMWRLTHTWTQNA